MTVTPQKFSPHVSNIISKYFSKCDTPFSFCDDEYKFLWVKRTNCEDNCRLLDKTTGLGGLYE
jgi:hypothetical protein